MKMPEIIRKDPVQNVDQSFEDDDHDQLDQLPTPERSPMHEEITHQIDSKTSEILQTDLNKDSHQEMSNSHTGMKAPQSFENPQPFDRQGVGNLHTGMKGPQSFERQPPQFRTPQPFQSAISTTELFTLSREKRSLFESIRSLIDSLIRPHENETRRHSTDDVSRVEIRSSSPSLMNQIDEIPTEQTPLKITDIFGRLNIADKIEKVKEIVKEKGKTKEQQFKSSKSSSSRSIESSDLNPANIIESKRNRKPNPKYAQLVYEE